MFKSNFFAEITCINKKTASSIVSAAIISEVVSILGGMAIGKMHEAPGFGAIIGGTIVGPTGIGLTILAWALIKTTLEFYDGDPIPQSTLSNPPSLVINL